VLGLPRLSQRGQGGGLAGAGRTDQHVEGAPGGGHRDHGGGLVAVQDGTTAGCRGGDHPPNQTRIHPGSGEGAAGVQQPGLGVEDGTRGVEVAELGLESAAAVGAAEHRRRHRCWGDGQQHRTCLHRRHQPAQQPVAVAAGGQPVAHGGPGGFGADVPLRPGGPAVMQPGQDLPDQLGLSFPGEVVGTMDRLVVAADDAGDQARQVGGGQHRGGTLAPKRHQHGQRVERLVPAGRPGGALPQPQLHRITGFVAGVLAVAADQVVGGILDLRPALGEVVDQPGGNAGDLPPGVLGLAPRVAHLPRHAQLSGQMIGQQGVVGLRQGHHRREDQPTRVEGPPPAILGLDPVGHHHMGV
jgi:hypothetical protein